MKIKVVINKFTFKMSSANAIIIVETELSAWGKSKRWKLNMENVMS
jgi:hypothetical protein